MVYCNIHTHQRGQTPDSIEIVNKIVDLKQSFCFLPNTYYSYGIHPWYINNPEIQLALLTEAALHPSVVAIGEAGLDKNSATPLQLQIEVFKEQVSLAEEIGKPVIIHCVKAWDELLAAQKSISPKQPWIIHGFRGNENLAKQLTSKQLWLSFGENFNPAAVRTAWPHHILAETDESKHSIEDIYSALASTIDTDAELFASTLRNNVKDILSI